MIPGAYLAAALAFGRTWWRAAVGAVLVAPLAFALGQCDGRRDEKAAQAGREAAAARVAVEQARKADTARNDALRAATGKIIADRKELDNAVAHIPDQAPSARQRARALVELCRTGRAPAGTAC